MKQGSNLSLSCLKLGDTPKWALAKRDNPFDLEVAYVQPKQTQVFRLPIEKRAASHPCDPDFKVKLQLPWQWHALPRGLRGHYLSQLGYLLIKPSSELTCYTPWITPSKTALAPLLTSWSQNVFYHVLPTLGWTWMNMDEQFSTHHLQNLSAIAYLSPQRLTVK